MADFDSSSGVLLPSGVALASKTPSEELGHAGVPTFGGMVSTEVDPVLAWKVPERWTTIAATDGDPDVLAVFRAISLPILATPLVIEPGSDRPEDREIAEFIERDLNNMTVSLAKHRAQSLRSPRWGNRIFETVFTRGDDGLYHLRKLASRPSSTIIHWHLDDHGGPDGVTQVLPDGKTVRLDMDRLLVFVYGEADLGLIGEPLTRAMYGPWMLKTQLAKVGALAVERHATGIPTIRYTGNKRDIRDRYESMLMGVHAHQKAFMLLAEGIESMGDFAIKGVEGSVLDPMEQMEFHRRGVYSAGMAQHMLLGAESTGSYALSADQSSNFLMAEQALLTEQEDTYQRYLIPRWVGYNWPAIPADRMPRVKHGPLARRDVKGWFDALTLAINAGVRLDRDAVDKMAIDLLGVSQPDEPEAEIAGVQDVNAPDEMQGDDAPAEAPAAALSSRRRTFPGFGSGRRATAADPVNLERASVQMIADRGVVIRFVELADRMDKRAEELDRKLTDLQRKAAKRLSGKVAKLIKDGDPEALTEWLADPDNTPSGEEEAAIEAALRDVYEDGYGDVWDELSQQRVQPERIEPDRLNRDRGWLAALAILAGRELAGRMAERAGYEGLGQIARGKLDAGSLFTAITGPELTKARDLVFRIENKATGAGRTAAISAAAAAGLTEEYVWTTMLDARVCQYGEGDCASLEGTTYTDWTKAPPVPNPGCLGGDRCRCGLVAFVDPDKRLPVPEGASEPVIEPFDEVPFGW